MKMFKALFSCFFILGVLAVSYGSHGAKIEKSDASTVKVIAVEKAVAISNVAFDVTKLLKFETDGFGTLPVAIIIPKSSYGIPGDIYHKNEPREYDLAHIRSGWLQNNIS